MFLTSNCDLYRRGTDIARLQGLTVFTCRATPTWQPTQRFPHRLLCTIELFRKLGLRPATPVSLGSTANITKFHATRLSPWNNHGCFASFSGPITLSAQKICSKPFHCTTPDQLKTNSTGAKLDKQKQGWNRQHLAPDRKPSVRHYNSPKWKRCGLPFGTVPPGNVALAAGFTRGGASSYSTKAVAGSDRSPHALPLYRKHTRRRRSSATR